MHLTGSSSRSNFIGREQSTWRPVSEDTLSGRPRPRSRPIPTFYNYKGAGGIWHTDCVCLSHRLVWLFWAQSNRGIEGVSSIRVERGKRAPLTFESVFLSS